MPDPKDLPVECSKLPKREPMSHHVEAVEIRPLAVPLKQPFQIASARLERVQNLIVAIGLDCGAIGHGEIATLFPVTADRFDSALEAAEELAEWLRDQVFEDWRLLVKALRTHETARPAIAAGFEMAIVEAISVHHELPLHRFFGSQQAPVFTDMTIPICEPEVCEKLAVSYREAGFETLKLKVGIDLHTDLNAIQSLRAGHPSCRIVADANSGFSLREAHTFLDALGKSKLVLDLFEQPVAHQDLRGLRELKMRGDTRIAADESCRSPDDALRLVENRCVDVLNIKLAKSGVLGALAIHTIAQTHQVGLMIGGMIETRIGMGFAAHLARGLGGFDWIDLDTPQLLQTDPVHGGAAAEGPEWTFDDASPGQGLRLEQIDLF